MKFRPMNDMVLIEPVEKESTIIILKDDSTHKRGIVVAVTNEEEFLQVGDKIVYSDNHQDITLDNVKYHLIDKKGIYFKEV